jgi:hypothetical protein
MAPHWRSSTPRGATASTTLKLIFENNIGKVAMEYVARPATDSKVRRFSLETDLLKKGAEEGYNAIRRYVDALTTTARVG